MNTETIKQLEQLEQVIAANLANAVAPQESDSYFAQFLDLLETGLARAAYQVEGVWQTAAVVKRLILLGFKLGRLECCASGPLQFCDKHNMTARGRDLVSNNIRIVAGGSSVRAGAFLGKSSTIMPPAFVNIGAYVGDFTMVDSHVTVGSCAQIGKHCHLSAAVQVGGVLEPVGALPTIVEDHCFIGGNSGIFEGTQVHQGAIIAAGSILTKSTRLYDVVNEQIITAQDGVLHVPQNAVVVPGSRTLQTPFAKAHGLAAYTPIIIKYRDAKSDTSTMLEELLR